MSARVLARARQRVRLQERDVRGIPNYSVTVPKQLVDYLGWRKGDELEALIVELEVDGRVVRGVLYFKSPRE